MTNSPTRWKPVPGYPAYAVSNKGQVRGSSGRILKPWLQKRGGYPAVKINQKTMCVHSLVLKAFIGPKPKGLEALHGDGDPTNDHLSNLRWGTKSENAQDMLRHGTWAKTHPTQGEKHWSARVTDKEALEIRQRYIKGVNNNKPGNARLLAEEFGVSRFTIWSIATGRTWGRI